MEVCPAFIPVRGRWALVFFSDSRVLFSSVDSLQGEGRHVALESTSDSSLSHTLTPNKFIISIEAQCEFMSLKLLKRYGRAMREKGDALLGSSMGLKGKRFDK